MTDLTPEQVAALDAAATQGVWVADGSHWEDVMLSNWENDRDLLTALVNLYRAGQLVVRTASEDDVERVGKAIDDPNIPLTHVEQKWGHGDKLAKLSVILPIRLTRGNA